MECRIRTNMDQFARLLEFMESHGDIARSQGVQGRIKADRLWQELAELLNSIGGGNPKSIEKWKRVWADWKAKTKKKALEIRNEACDTVGGPSSRRTLTTPEQRLLRIMGLAAVVGQVEIEEKGFEEQPTQINTPPTPTRDLSSQSATDPLDFMPSCHGTEGNSTCTDPSPVPPPSPSEVSQAQRLSQKSVQPLDIQTSIPSTPIPSAMSPNAVSSQRAPRRLQHSATPSLISSTRSAPQRRLHRARTQRVQTPYERTRSEFVSIENRRLRFEEDREKNHHQREMERIKNDRQREIENFQLESRRIEIEQNRNQTLSHLTNVLNRLTEILQRLRPSS